MCVCGGACLRVCIYSELHKIKEHLPMVRETKVQSQVESYQKLKKWYLMLPC